MTAYVIGELTADRASIVLIATGPDHEVAQAARYMQTLTPLMDTLCSCRHTQRRHHEQRGQCNACPCPALAGSALQLPATWVAVVQLASTFGNYWRPGPALTAWITEQILARTSEGGELTVAPPAGLTPRPYQVAGARMIGMVGSALLFDDPGPQPVTTPILTPTGWTELGQLTPGDVVFDLHGRPTPVRAVKHFGEQPVYRVTLSDRTSTLATAEHRWRVYTANDRRRDNGGRVLSTAQMLEAGLRYPNGAGRVEASRFYLPQQPVVQGLGSEHEALPLDPYAYGALLGDGALGGDHLSITCPDDFILRRVGAAADALGTSFRLATPEDRCQALIFRRTGKLAAVLDELNARTGAATKTVDPRYRLASLRTRRAVLAGLLDTDGTVTKDGAGVEFSSASPVLASEVAWLGRSLGAVVTESEPQSAGYRDAAGERVECLPKHRVSLRFLADGPNPFALPRKALAWAKAADRVQRRNPPRTVRSIEPEGSAEVCCIELDTDDDRARVYLTDAALIPTHNTGKTVTAILGLVERAAAGHPVWPVVVVCPSAVVDSWVSHVQAWAPGVRVVPWRGSPARRRKRIGTADVYVASYGTAARDAATADVAKIARGHASLMSLCARMVIADEVHKVKAQQSTYSRAVRNLAARAASLAGGFVGLSGTPITHGPKDAWPALYCMSPGAWPSGERWATRYCDTLPGEYAVQVLGFNSYAEPEFRQTLLGQYRRVAKADVLADLPPKVYSIRRVEMPDRYRKAYDALESELLADMPDGGDYLEAPTVLSQLGRLLQLASAPCDVEAWTEIEVDPATGLEMEVRKQNVTMRAPSWKVEELLEVMAERPGHQVAAFAPSRQLMMLAGEQAAAAGYRVGYLVGVGGEVTMKTRAADVEAFQRGELDLICVTTAAGGVGVTLTAASTVVFLQRPWSLVDALQAEDRCHRIGSERHDSIEIIDIVAQKTIETRVREVLKERAGQLSDFVMDPRIVAELLGGAGVRDLRKARSAA